ncbi:Nucleolar protein 58 [Puccinia graminis f. sp. tritici]|uniref:Nucleolar protein 58 n=1 Tax=Puccinia graminis f. sp. tritici TaxID=56615 RepID=A0A5B0SHB0_PUCGR|nr:Nucleolar protein 58 [Puccinia graminis f. sp. tritici]
MLVLFESSVGFCLFKVADNGSLLTDGNLYKKFDSPASASNLVKLQSIHRFKSTADAVEDLSAIGDGKLSKNLKKFLIDEISGGVEGKKSKETLAVVDPKLGGAITKKLGFNVLSDSTTTDLFRGIRSQLAPLLGDYNVDESDLNTMNLGLSHSLSRFKLKYSTDKVDTMIVQAIALLDDLDKEVNIYAMRVKEWYGWHFPEMAKIISDNLAYAKIVKTMGLRTNHSKTDFSEILPEELEGTLKASAAISMGTEISDSDLLHIQSLATQVISLMQYRTELFEYLRNRMTAIAPNLTAILGELVGARLIAHSGSLINLAKAPASTIQILGAEKALFRALKTKHDTPKYGLIFHSSLVGSAPGKLKGKMARMTAAKAALSIRHDALADADTKSTEEAPLIGMEARIKLESRLRRLEQSIGIQSNRKSGVSQDHQKPFFKRPDPGSYNPAADSLMIPAANNPAPSTTGEGQSKKPLIEEIKSQTNDDEEAEAKRKRKEEKKAKKAARASLPGTTSAPSTEPSVPPQPTSSSSKDKKRKHHDDDDDDEAGDKSATQNDGAAKEKSSKSSKKSKRKSAVV